MRILIVAFSYPSASNPISGIFLHDQAQMLARHHDVRVLAADMILFPSITTAPRMRQERLDGVAIHRSPVLRTPGLHPLPLLLAHFRSRLRVVLDELAREWGRPDLIHAHVALPAGAVAVELGRTLGVPVVLTEHTGPFSVLIRDRQRRRYTSRAFLGAAAVTAVSPSLAAEIGRFLPSLDVEILGCPVRTDLFNIEASSALVKGHTFTVLSVALLSPIKGIDVLLEAMAILKRTGVSDIQLLIGGDGPIRRTLEEQARASGIENRVRFLGMLNRHEILKQMRGCDVFVLPSRTETFGMVLAEALACGKPVIATRVGGPQYIVEEGMGLLVPPDDADSLADALLRSRDTSAFLPPSELRASVVRRFGPEANLASLERIYRRVCSDGSSGDRSGSPVARQGCNS